jgi:hypothetical protein
VHCHYAMAQAVCRRPLTAGARVSRCGICGGKSGTRTEFSPEFFVFPCEYISTVALRTHVSGGGGGEQ